MSTPDPSLNRSSQNQQSPRLPRQIQAQADRARQLEAERNASPAAPQPGEPPAPGATQPTLEAPTQDTPQPGPQPPADDALLISPGKLDLVQLINLADYSAPDPTRENDPTYWKARYMVADGIAKKTRVVNETNRSLQSDNDRLKAEVERLKAGAPPAAAPAAPKPEDIDLSLYYTPAQIEEHGEASLRAHLAAILDASGKIIEERVSARLEPIEQERETERQQGQRQSQERAQQLETEYLDALTELLPEWSEINKDPRWLRWLDGLNDDGIKRQAVLDQHAAARNVERTAALFKAYLKDAGAQPKPPIPPPLPPPTPPGTPPGPPVMMAQMPFPMTPAGYKQWKTAVARSGGVWRGNVELTKQIEGRYNAAIADGSLMR